jgi:hypothetical protein
MPKLLLFKSVFIPGIVTGTKTLTLRRTTNVRAGDEVWAANGYTRDRRVALLHITSVEHLQVRQITPQMAREDGHATAAAMRRALHSFYPGASQLFCLRWAVLRVVDEHPLVAATLLATRTQRTVSRRS